MEYMIVTSNAHYARRYVKEFKLSGMSRRYPTKRYVVRIHLSVGILQHTTMCITVLENLASEIKQET
jgi:hypothetical protein